MADACSMVTASSRKARDAVRLQPYATLAEVTNAPITVYAPCPFVERLRTLAK